MRAMLLRLFARSVWALYATELAGTTREGAVQASVLWVGVASSNHLGGWHFS